MYERLHETHDLVDEGDRVDNVDLLQAAGVTVLKMKLKVLIVKHAKTMMNKNTINERTVTTVLKENNVEINLIVTKLTLQTYLSFIKTY